MADHTEYQSPDDQSRARELSLREASPPADVPGYELQRFLGAGAYGEVWVGVDQNTGRSVAIKFYTHRGSVDWSLLSREVEKLVFLSSNRYVVQLLDVGWDSDPPYYVMEFIEQGSLDMLLAERGALPPDEAAELFRELVTGLTHAHDKGVLHCDLKPANVLLDQDGRPRLADFGQSRLSTEQSPSLGTLFYMAPEQADLEAAPDARWDVYAVGALFYCTLTGNPPYRSPEAMESIEQAGGLPERLAAYRRIIRKSPPPREHRKAAGLDGSLAAILERCLQPRPQDRFASAHALLDALRERDRVRAQRPLLVLGFAGPLLWLLITAVFGAILYYEARSSKERDLVRAAQETNYFAAQTVASKADQEIARYFRAVETIAEQDAFLDLLAPFASDPVASLTRPLSSADRPADAEAIASLLANPDQQTLQQRVRDLLRQHRLVEAASWFVCDAQGVQIAAAFRDPYARSTIGHNYAWRTYFHDGPDDLIRSAPDGAVVHEKPSDDQRLSASRLSAPFQSQATKRWKVAIATPLRRDGQFLGVLAVTVDVESFLHFNEGNSRSFFAVLVDGRPSRMKGLILKHPAFDKFSGMKLPENFGDYRTEIDRLPKRPPREGAESAAIYQDPLGADPSSPEFAKDWIAMAAPVSRTGLYIVVQQDRDRLIEPVRELGALLIRMAMFALVSLVAVVALLWYAVTRVLRPADLARPWQAGRLTLTTSDQSTAAATSLADGESTASS